MEQFIRRNLGAEVFERLIEPFCSGVYAGDPSKLSMQAAFNRVRAALPRVLRLLHLLLWSCCSGPAAAVVPVHSIGPQAVSVHVCEYM